MQENSSRLLDEALSHEPIKNTFRLAWEFIVLNKNFTLTAMSLLLLLNLLSTFLGFFAMVISGIFSMAIQIYVARVLYEADGIEQFVEKSKKAKIEEVLSSHALSATGAYFGLLSLFLVLLLLFGFMVSSMQLNLDGMNMQELIDSLEVFLLPSLMVLLLVSYLHPLVQANITFTNDFKEGYKAAWSFFSQGLWRDAFQKEYFRYVVLIFLLLLALGVMLGIFVTLPGVNLLVNFIVIVLMYVYAIISAVVAMMARKIVEREAVEKKDM